jgi:hypothetical protein
LDVLQLARAIFKIIKGYMKSKNTVKLVLIGLLIFFLGLGSGWLLREKGVGVNLIEKREEDYDNDNYEGTEENDRNESNQDNDDANNNDGDESNNDEVKWEVYINKNYGFKLEYPSSWMKK